MLGICVRVGDDEMVKYLLEHGADAKQQRH